MNLFCLDFIYHKLNLLFRLDKTYLELTKQLETKYFAFNNQITSFSRELTELYDQNMEDRQKRNYIKEVVWKVNRL